MARGKYKRIREAKIEAAQKDTEQNNPPDTDDMIYDIMSDGTPDDIDVEGKNYVFISYKRRDKDRIKDAVNLIHSRAYTWVDRGTPGGDVWEHNIIKHARECRVFVAFISESYFDNRANGGRGYCQKELQAALGQNIRILPVYLDKIEEEYYIERGLEEVYEDLKVLERISLNDEGWFKRWFIPNLDFQACLRPTPILSPEEKKELERQAEEQRKKEEAERKIREKEEEKKRRERERQERIDQKNRLRQANARAANRKNKAAIPPVVLAAVFVLAAVVVLSVLATRNHTQTAGTDASEARTSTVPFRESGFEDHVMEWNDAALETAMRDLTGIAEGDIMLSDVWPYSSLDLTGYGVADISALAELTQLETLVLNSPDPDRTDSAQEVHVTGYAALASMKDLKELNLKNTQLNDADLREVAAVLKTLPAFRQLTLSNNQLKDITPLSELTSLTYLLLSDNEIEEIGALSGLVNMQILWLNRNRISDLSALADMKQLTQLSLTGNLLEDKALEYLKDKTSLSRLYLSDNNLNDMSALSGLTSLRELWIDNNAVTDITALSGMTKMTELYLNNNSIVDVSPLTSMLALRTLWLNGNHVADVSPLTALTGLQSLHLENNPVKDDSMIREMKIPEYNR